ncbi:MobF family relaxase [Cellulomonas sp. URHE0023]|uniref:MobF family relaxase n=1 Tax=Cellulomonas sp. URHE0023 TaxID=1380354 RepID=UPI00055549F1|nr:MobF family relaxase [Cellulomonas sp. URHE0023]
MHKLTVGDGYAYLTRHVAAGDAGLSADDSLTAYYEQTGNPSGRWIGGGLDALGDGRLRSGAAVSEAAMTAVFRDGRNPVTLEPLGTPYKQIVPGEGRHTVAGYDLTFTAPKSDSVLWGLADDRTRTALYDAHRAALTSALKFVEHSVIRTRVGAAGCRQVRTRGMVAAAFDHWDSRAGDPNLHTHVVVANKVQGPDGAWRSVDGRTLHGAVVTVSELYDALLADEVSRRLGATWSLRARGERRNPAFEVDGVGEDLLAEFSGRSEQIHCAEQRWAEEFAEQRGRAPSRVETTRARQHLTRETRPPKVVRALQELLADWANRARALTGVEPVDLAARALAGRYSRPLRAGDVGPEVRAAIVAQVLEDVSTRRSVWSTWNLGAAALRSSLVFRMASPEDRVRLTNTIVTEAGKACVRLDDDTEPARRRVGEETFTSLELLRAERTLLDAAEATVPLGIHQLAGRLADQRMAHLSVDQREAAKAVLLSPRQLAVLVGPAGTGKTTTLAALADEWRRTRGTVIGLAPSASAAATLSDALGARCETTAKWMFESVGDAALQRALRYAARTAVVDGPTVTYSDRVAANERRNALAVDQEQWRFRRGDLVIVDEASMADTRTLAALIDQASAAEAKVLLVGDHLQRGAVDAGGGFGMLARRGPTAELRTLWRFSQPWEARATLELRHGDPAALDAYIRHGRISHGTHDDMLDDALTAAQDAEANGRVVLLAAADRRTVNELNARTRAERVRTGDVRTTGITLSDGLTGGVGDRIVTRRNNRRLRTSGGFVRNGDLWQITAVLPDGGVRVRAAGDAAAESLRLPSAYVAESVELGYATTTARSQGMTVDETHTVITAGMGREDLYVAVTRGRHLNRLYVATDRPDPECLPSGELDGPRELLDRVLATTHGETSATETWAAHHPESPEPPLPITRPQPVIPPLRPQITRSPLTPPTSPSPDGPVLERW